MKKRIAALSVAALMALGLASCGDAPAAEIDTAAGDEEIVVIEAEEATTEEATTAPMRADGERFEAVILLEGMEETVHYEHIRSESIGFEMDYDYEMLERRSDAEGECFVPYTEGAEDPWNYFELRYDTGNANLVADALKASLSGSYDTVTEEEFSLEAAGDCVLVKASGAKAGVEPSGSLQRVYVIPTGEGCIVATAHCTYESAEGFGARANYMLHTLTVIEG